ncbi:hypothetical protein DSO57_1021104 [Entomophthora muscae]|uniref:Uncharacterized protein n=1 Tax=Entomophthora muscae TaxID=34485 RepID=A0ACC2UDY5_9FUNG|nr:hypothetical protein DSO57_1021104 [Entomophthora muscae]
MYIPMYHQYTVPACLIEEVKPVLDTTYDLYKGQEKESNRKGLHYYHTLKKQRCLKRTFSFMAGAMPIDPTSLNALQYCSISHLCQGSTLGWLPENL